MISNDGGTIMNIPQSINKVRNVWYEENLPFKKFTPVMNGLHINYNKIPYPPISLPERITNKTLRQKTGQKCISEEIGRRKYKYLCYTRRKRSNTLVHSAFV